MVKKRILTRWAGRAGAGRVPATARAALRLTEPTPADAPAADAPSPKPDEESGADPDPEPDPDEPLEDAVAAVVESGSAAYVVSTVMPSSAPKRFA